MAPDSRSDIEAKTSYMEDELQKELTRLRQARNWDRVANLALVLCINATLLIVLYFLAPTIKMSESIKHSPSEFAYQIKLELLAVEQKMIQQPSLDPRIENTLWSSAVSFETGFIWIDNPMTTTCHQVCQVDHQENAICMG